MTYSSGKQVADVAQLAERRHGKAKIIGSIPIVGSRKNKELQAKVCTIMDIQFLAQRFYDYSSYIRGYSRPTIVRYRQVIHAYCRFACVTEIEQVTNENVRAFFFHGRTKLTKPWTPNTFIGYHKSLVVFFRWCITEGHLKQNPMDDIETPKLEKRLPPKLTKQEALKLLEVAYNYPYDYRFLRYRNYAIFATFVFAGLRKKELLHLKCVDVDIENLSIFIRQGKGSKDRVVPMSSTLAGILQRYLEERRRLKKTCPEFFASLNRNVGFTETGLRGIVRTVRRASGIGFTIHRLRHTFATLMLEGGCDIYSLSRMMGHSDIKTTTIYLAASAELLRAQMGKHPLNDM